MEEQGSSGNAGSSGQSASPAVVSVHYLVRIPLAIAESIVGRPWAHDGEDDDSWECSLEKKVKDHLPDLLEFADVPDVEFYG